MSIERAQVAQQLYTEVEASVRQAGGEIDIYLGRRSVLLIPASAQAPRQCVEAFAAVQQAVNAKGDLIRDHLGVSPALKAGVARGVLHSIEVVGQVTRDIVTDGEALDQAALLEQLNRNATMLFADDLGEDLRGAGYDPERITTDAFGDTISCWVVTPS